VRAEFYNIFNRLILPNPTATNPLASTATNAQGVLTSGFGYINGTTITGERTGQLVFRIVY
jgi:hypothetical protein